ncbi:hypothetical protein D9757_004478 [Collybiopsis confluens]|uniref:Uncharacterized protein n=1 Tax=Collybiopsis confluens TaxID=2823264 RepID=A0A8H5MED3_9AGAR|nr:hypothetical protein D9757_004478 [Collybiopsis confluens]
MTLTGFTFDAAALFQTTICLFSISQNPLLTFGATELDYDVHCHDSDDPGWDVQGPPMEYKSPDYNAPITRSV